MSIIFLSAHTRPIYPSYAFCRQPIYSPYHGYNYSYLMLTNFIGSSYMRDFFAMMLPIGSFMGVVCVLLFRVYACL